MQSNMNKAEMLKLIGAMAEMMSAIAKDPKLPEALAEAQAEHAKAAELHQKAVDTRLEIATERARLESLEKALEVRGTALAKREAELDDVAVKLDADVAAFEDLKRAQAEELALDRTAFGEEVAKTDKAIASIKESLAEREKAADEREAELDARDAALSDIARELELREGALEVRLKKLKALAG